MANPSNNRLTAGQVSFSGGVDSSKPPSQASEVNPQGLKSNQLAWLANGVVRGGSISNRQSWSKLAAFEIGIGILQEAKMYHPMGETSYPSQSFGGGVAGFPYIHLDIGGRTFNVRVDSDNSIEEVTIPGDPNPADLPQHWMCQGEEFMVHQNMVSTPLVWDGAVLRRVTSMLNADPKIPVAGPMAYYQSRFWLANGREILGSDIVKGPSGTGTITPFITGYGKRDSILSVKESLYELGGGVITVPSNGGNIRALDFTANLDTALGQGTLFAFTNTSIYSVNVVPTRAEWIAATEPIVRIANINYGCISDRSIVKINGDLFFQTPIGLMSLTMAIRNFQQWGQTGISKEENRVMRYNNRALMKFVSGIEFDNRSLQCVLPIQTPVGVACLGIMPLDFDIISTLGERLPPAWEGMWEGLDTLRLLEADFGGRQRAFAIVHSRLTGGIEVWELNQTGFNDEDDRRIVRVIEFPSLDNGQPFELRQLDTMELWFDQVSGTVEFMLEYREGQNTCWHPWKTWDLCYARNNCESIGAILPCDYPQQPYSLGYFATLVAPQAKHDLCDKGNKRPTNIAYAFQARLTTKGQNRLRGYAMHMLPRDKGPYEGIVC